MSIEDLIPEDFWDIHAPKYLDDTISIDDIKLSQDVPLVISYMNIDLKVTNYNFKQKFTEDETKEYFERMSYFSQRSINEILDEVDHTYHFHRTEIKGNIRRLLQKLAPNCLKNNNVPMVFHFALTTDEEGADRNTGKRSPRIYFFLGASGIIYPLFFDPFHEINPSERFKQNTER